MEPHPPRRPWWPIVLALALVAAAEGLVLHEVGTLPEPLPASAPVQQFSAGRARAVLERLVAGERPRPTGTREAEAFRARLIDELRALGLQPEVQEGVVVLGGTVARIRNVVAVVPGRERDGKVLLLEAHADSVPAGPGVSDDASGVACLVEIARALRAGEPPRHPVVLLADEGEEIGLLGARLFATEHPLATRVGAVIVLEARGTTGPSALWRLATDGRGNGWMIEAARGALSRPVTSGEIAELAAMLPNDTDMSMLARSGMVGFDFAFGGGVARYHSPRDDMAALDMRTLQHHGQGGLELARQLAESDFGEGVPPARVAWFDVLGRGIVAARLDGPWRWIRLVAWVAAWVAGVVLLRRRGGLEPSGVLAGGWALVALPGIGLVAGLGIVALEKRLTGSSAPATADAWLTTLAVALAALAAVLVVLALLPRRCTAAGALAGSAFAWLVLAASFAAVAPRWAALIPELIAALLSAATLAAGTLGRRPHAAPILSLVPLACAAVPVLELGYALHVMSGPALPVLGAVPVAVLATLLVPAAATTRTGARWACACAALVGSAAVLVVAARAPSFTADEPRHVNVVYRLDASSSRAWWTLVAEDDDPPQAAFDGPTAAAFREQALDGWPVPTAKQVAAPAPAVPMKGARIEAVSEEASGSARRVVLRVVPSEGALNIVVRVPLPLPGQGDEDRPILLLAGTRAPTDDYGTFIRLVAPPPEGALVELELPGGSVTEVLAFERHAGLPEGADAPARGRLPHATRANQGDGTIVLTRAAIGGP